jgi:hypothetical protein
MSPNLKSKLLTAYLAEPLPPFDWQAANCGHFAGAFVAQVEGADPLAGLALGKSLRATRRILADAGGLAALVSRQLAREPIAPAFGQLGDMVLLPLSDADPLAQALGLCCGEVAAVRDEAGGVHLLPMASALAAWRVGA